MNETFLFCLKSAVQRRHTIICSSLVRQNNNARGNKLPVQETHFKLNMTRKKKKPDQVPSLKST